MNAFTIRVADQLPILLRAFRKEAGLTQNDVALRLGVTQQTYSTLERNAEKVSAARLLSVLAVLGVELVLNKPASTSPELPSTRAGSGMPTW